MFYVRYYNQQIGEKFGWWMLKDTKLCPQLLIQMEDHTSSAINITLKMPKKDDHHSHGKNRMDCMSLSSKIRHVA